MEEGRKTRWSTLGERGNLGMNGGKILKDSASDRWQPAHVRRQDQAQ